MLDEGTCNTMVEKGACYVVAYDLLGNYCQKSCDFCPVEKPCDSETTIKMKCEQKCMIKNEIPYCECYKGYEVNI